MSESAANDLLPGRTLYKTGAIATVLMVMIIPIQILIFVSWPPPETVEGFYTLFRENWLLGLMSLDLLYIVNNTLIVLMYLAIYSALSQTHKSSMIIAMVLGFIGIAAYYPSNPAFEMMSLSSQYAAAMTEPQRLILLAAGESLMASYSGTSFNVYYVLNGVALLIIAVVMLKTSIFTRLTAIMGLLAAIFMMIPSSFGLIGMIFSLASLVPWAVFSVAAAKRFFQLANEET